MQNKKIGIPSLVLICLMAFTPTYAASPKKSKSNKKKARVTTHIASNSSKIKSSENTETIISPKEQSYRFTPDFNKATKDETLALSLPYNLLADASADVSTSMEMVKKRMLEQKEMRELSSRLGVKITNPSLLDFYREVSYWLGTRYRLGGMSRSGVDCSGFTNIIYNTVFNKKLDRVSTTIAKNVKESLSKDELEPGDMVFFSTFKRKYINHVGVYIGDGLFVHASIKKGVIVSSLSEGYYSTAWRKGGRI